MTERVLVTGATGFIGYHLVYALLQAGSEVHCLIRPTSDTSRLEGFDVSFVQGDVTRKESLVNALSDVNTVFHLASSTAVLNPEIHFLVNEGGTKNLAQACAETGTPKRLVVISSFAAVGPSPGGRPMTEEDPPSPVSHYGRSKLAGEQAALKWAGELPITIVRPPMVFGEYDRDVFKMFDLVAHGWHLIPSLRKRYYSLIHAADLAKGLILAARNGEILPPQNGIPPTHGQGIYFIADALTPSYAELGLMIADALDRKVMGIRIPGLVTWGVAIGSEILARIRRKPSILNLDKAREGLAGSWVCSPQKAESQLGFKPEATIRERMHQTGRWYQEQGWL